MAAQINFERGVRRSHSAVAQPDLGKASFTNKSSYVPNLISMEMLGFYTVRRFILFDPSSHAVDMIVLDLKTTNSSLTIQVAQLTQLTLT